MIFSFYANSSLISRIECLDGFEKQRFGANWFNVEVDDEDEESQQILRDILGECSCAWQEEINSGAGKYSKKPRKGFNAPKASW